jgi:hypothetical protein
MTLERSLRGIAGAFVLLSLALAVWVNKNWLWFTAFVGANLLQSAFTNWCPMMALLRRLGVRDSRPCCAGEQ